jgi:hypothetical protein
VALPETCHVHVHALGDVVELQDAQDLLRQLLVGVRGPPAAGDVGGDALDLEVPLAQATPGGREHTAGAALVDQREVGLAGGLLDQVAGPQRAGLLVAVEDQGDRVSLQLPFCMEGRQGPDHDHQAALHVTDARASGRGALDPEVLEVVVGFEDGVHVPDHQDAASSPGERGLQVGAAVLGAGVTGDLEAQRLELADQPLHHPGDALLVPAPRVLAHQLAEQSDHAHLVAADPVLQPALQPGMEGVLRGRGGGPPDP